MIVENREGAGGLTGTNYAYAAKPDGLTLGVGLAGPGLISSTLSQDPAVKFDIKKMSWIEYLNPQAQSMMISAKLPYTSMDEFSKVKGVKFGSSNKANVGSTGAALVAELFGLQNAKIVLGYGGAAEAMLALGKGEVDAYVTGSADLLSGISKGFAKKPLVRINYERDPYFPDVPTIPELMKLTQAQQDLLTTFTAFVSAQLFWYHPGVPADRVEFVRNAFDKMVVNDNFVKQDMTTWPIFVKPTAGKDYGAQLDKILAVATPERFQDLLKLVDKYLP